MVKKKSTDSTSAASRPAKFSRKKSMREEETFVGTTILPSDQETVATRTVPPSPPQVRFSEEGASTKGNAGAGVFGLLGAITLFAVAAVFFLMENYFVSLFLLSMSLLVYATGAAVARIFLSAFSIFFTSRHLLESAAALQEAAEAFKTNLRLHQDANGQWHAALPAGGQLILPNNPLISDLKNLREQGFDAEYGQYIAHRYFAECHELYGFSIGNLDFVGNSMPLYGLMGTILGFISMFDSLSSNVTVDSLAPQLAMALKTTLYGAALSSAYRIISARFEQRQKALEYDFETLCYSIDVLFKHDFKIEVQK